MVDGQTNGEVMEEVRDIILGDHKDYHFFFLGISQVSSDGSAENRDINVGFLNGRK